MPLPILQLRHQPTDSDLVRLFHGTETRWVEHLAEPELLEVGTAYANPALIEWWDANHVRDVSLPDETTPAEAIALVDANFARRGSTCAYWVMNPSSAEARTRPMVEHLTSRGFTKLIDDIFYLRSTPRKPIVEPAGLRFIPGRASYKHFRELMEEKTAEQWNGLTQVIEAQTLHLDDPHVDGVLALYGQRPVAYLAVMAVGEVGRIEGVYVAKDFRGRGVGRALMGRALEVCARSLFKHVFLSVDPANAPAQSLYRGVGFERIGEVVSYRRPG